jgi:hypothetical protein
VVVLYRIWSYGDKRSPKKFEGTEENHEELAEIAGVNRLPPPPPDMSLDHFYLDAIPRMMMMPNNNVPN